MGTTGFNGCSLQGGLSNSCSNGPHEVKGNLLYGTGAVPFASQNTVVGSYAAVGLEAGTYALTNYADGSSPGANVAHVWDAIKGLRE
jgi:hypothetical protein